MSVSSCDGDRVSVRPDRGTPPVPADRFRFEG